MATIWESAATFERGTVLKLSFVAFVYLDLVLTVIAVQSGFREMNPFMMRMLSEPLALVLVKISLPPFLAWLTPAKLLLPSVLFMLAVIAWNFSVLLTAA